MQAYYAYINPATRGKNTNATVVIIMMQICLSESKTSEYVKCIFVKNRDNVSREGYQMYLDIHYTSSW